MQLSEEDYRVLRQPREAVKGFGRVRLPPGLTESSLPPIGSAGASPSHDDAKQTCLHRFRSLARSKNVLFLVKHHAWMFALAKQAAVFLWRFPATQSKLCGI